jgi:hypothetical protein
MFVMFEFEHSSDHIKKTLRDTGHRLAAERTFSANATDLTPAERQVFLIDSGAWKRGRESDQPVVVSLRQQYDFDDGPGICWSGRGLWEYDADVADVHELLSAYLAYVVGVDERRSARRLEQAEAEQARQAEKARRQAEEAEAARKRSEEAAPRRAKWEEGRESLRTWATEHGSDLLKARVDHAMEFEWDKLAVAEKAEQLVDVLVAGLPLVRVPDSYENDFRTVGVDMRTTPTLAEIRVLEAVRAAAEGNQAAEGVEVDLTWITYEDPKDYDDPDREVSRAELRICVPHPYDDEKDVRAFYFEIGGE